MGYYFEGDGYRQWIMSMMPNIHSNNNIPQEIKDSWIELALSENIEKLHENVAVFENGSMT